MKRFRSGEEGEMDSVNMANVLMLLSRGSGAGDDQSDHGPHHPGRVFECKTCNRQFPSFQALGGHRASHKKPRHQLGDPHGQLAQQQAALSKPKVHECPICGLEFAIGQALGGHMRRHRAATEGFSHAIVEKKSSDHNNKNHECLTTFRSKKTINNNNNKRVLCLNFDLNLPPSENNVDVDFRTLNFELGLPMVDCLH